jgi:hypothetical protein
VCDDPVIRVPWLEPPYDNRRNIVREETTIDDSGRDPAVADERLRALGYVE